MPTTAGKAWLFYALAVLAVSPATVVAEPEAPDAAAGHPRLIVTREQLTNLRTRLNSPAGKAFVRAILARVGEDW